MTSFAGRNDVVRAPMFAQRIRQDAPGVSIEPERYKESRLCRSITMPEIQEIPDDFLALDD